MSRSAEIIFVCISSLAWFNIPQGEIIALFPPLDFDRVLPFFNTKMLLFFALFVVRGCPFTCGCVLDAETGKNITSAPKDANLLTVLG
jgi:hypothetical protein